MSKSHSRRSAKPGVRRCRRSLGGPRALTWALLGGAAGCGSPAVDGPPAPRSSATPAAVASAGYEGVNARVADDPDMEALIAPYRDRMARELTQVIGHAGGAFAKSDPEGALDNLVADALLDEVNEMGEPVDAVLLNDGGLRIPLPAGPLTVSQAYELLPFENYVTVLTFTGRQMEALADEVARTGGEPVAGWTLAIDGNVAVDVRIGGSPVDPDARYRLATVDYLANGGGSWTVLWEPAERVDLSILIRDVFMEYVREEGTVEPRLDGRIRVSSREGVDDRDSRLADVDPGGPRHGPSGGAAASGAPTKPGGDS